MNDAAPTTTDRINVVDVTLEQNGLKLSGLERGRVMWETWKTEVGRGWWDSRAGARREISAGWRGSAVYSTRSRDSIVTAGR
ncbi:MAG TPA: hypothetical protein PLV92_02200, partial [Pirellulaceae bacterium]|nr:hypothetical protein [Pirellulaceae bacterium]